MVRSLRQWVDTPPAAADLRSLRLIVTLGDRIDAETRDWLDFEVGGGRALVANAWGQTELAGLVTVTPAPATPEVPDPGLEVVDGAGRPWSAGATGELVLLHPWPGTFLEVAGGPLNHPEGLAATTPGGRPIRAPTPPATRPAGRPTAG